MTNDGVRKIYQLHNEGDRTWRDIYEAPGLVGALIRAEVPREDQAPGTVRRHLLRNGAAKSAIEDDNILQAAIATEAPVVRRAEQPGWRDDNRCFVSHRHVAGEVSGSEVLPPVNALVGVEHMKIRGTVASWKQIIDVAKYSTSMIVGLCAVFAAPLLAPLNRQSFGICLFAASRCGKSTVQLVMGSALGLGREEDLPGLHGTESGLLARVKANNDHAMIINEVGTASGSKNKVHEVLHSTIYTSVGGQDKVRHPSWTNALNGPESFRLILVFSTEVSPDVWAARNGEAREPGEMARMIGLPVLFEGSKTIFDCAPPSLKGDELRTWEREQFRLLRDGLPENRGTAFPEYIDALLDDIGGHTSRARTLVDSFVKKLVHSGMSPVAQDIVAKFGVLYAGGVIAYETEVLDFDESTIFQAVRDACFDALAEIPDSGAELREGIKLLRERLSGGSILDVNDLSTRKRVMLSNADGYQQKHNAGRLYVVRAQAFTDWFSSTLSLRRLLEWLDDEGFLNNRHERTQRKSNEWAQRQVGWPNGARVRSISIYLPNGLADLKRVG